MASTMDQTLIDKLDKFFSGFKHQRYKQGEILVRADEDPSGIFYLKEGIVKKYAISRKGDELVVNLFRPISFFPMSWAINNSPNKYFYEAITNLDLWKAPKDAAVDFLKKEPELLFDLLKRVYIGTDGLLMRMVYLMSGSAHNRLITEILIHAKRFGLKNSRTSVITCRITEKELAARAGMTRETVSRELSALKSQNTITVEQGKLIISDIHKLEKLLAEDFNALT